jgi:diguanylate cyclase (GGDEF)-like protein
MMDREVDSDHVMPIDRDPVTGVMSRRQALATLEAPQIDAAIHGVIAFDIDGFHDVNRRLGFERADRVLLETARRVQRSMRRGDLLARTGGDEFVVVLRSPASPAALHVIADRLIRAMTPPYIVDGIRVEITASAGIAHSDGTVSGTDLIHRAEAAVRAAKADGPGSVLLAETGFEERRSQFQARTSELRNAFEHRDLAVRYQPEFNLTTGRILGVEALARWRHPQEGLLDAAAFIDIAEESGLIDRIGTWIIGEVMRDAQRWHAMDRRLVVRLNLSARQLVDDGIVIDIRDALGTNRVEAGRVCVEVTESHIIHRVRETAHVLRRLRELGVNIALDDFGTGYSSMSYIKDLPIDVIKIDRRFVQNIEHDPEDEAIVTSIIDLGTRLNLDIVAEGIETTGQLARLIALGCHRGQGYLLSEAVEAGDIDDILASPRRGIPL